MLRTYYSITLIPSKTFISQQISSSAPRRDSSGRISKICDGVPNCHLHLHGSSSFLRDEPLVPAYSVDSAVGLVLGTGNIGEQLSFNPNETHTYLSRDGGLSWREIHKRPMMYEFGDHGGVILMASMGDKTNEVLYSWDMGETWYLL